VRQPVRVLVVQRRFLTVTGAFPGLRDEDADLTVAGCEGRDLSDAGVPTLPIALWLCRRHQAGFKKVNAAGQF
jgi:hypothetical protein